MEQNGPQRKGLETLSFGCTETVGKYLTFQLLTRLANRRIRPLCHLSGVRRYSLPWSIGAVATLTAICLASSLLSNPGFRSSLGFLLQIREELARDFVPDRRRHLSERGAASPAREF